MSASSSEFLSSSLSPTYANCSSWLREMLAPRNMSLSFLSKISRLSLKSSKMDLDNAGSTPLDDNVVVDDVKKQTNVVNAVTVVGIFF